MRLSRMIWVAAIVLAVAGSIFASKIMMASSSPDLGEPIVVSPSPSDTPSTKAPSNKTPSGKRANPVNPNAPSAGDDDDWDEDDWDEDDWDEDD